MWLTTLIFFQPRPNSFNSSMCLVSHFLIFPYWSYCSLVSRMILKQFDESESQNECLPRESQGLSYICCIISHTKLSGLKQQPIITTHGSVSHNLVSNSSIPCGMSGALAGVQRGTLARRAGGLGWSGSNHFSVQIQGAGSGSCHFLPRAGPKIGPLSLLLLSSG